MCYLCPNGWRYSKWWRTSACVQICCKTMYNTEHLFIWKLKVFKNDSNDKKWNIIVFIIIIIRVSLNLQYIVMGLCMNAIPSLNKYDACRAVSHDEPHWHNSSASMNNTVSCSSYTLINNFTSWPSRVRVEKHVFVNK